MTTLRTCQMPNASAATASAAAVAFATRTVRSRSEVVSSAGCVCISERREGWAASWRALGHDPPGVE